MQARKDFDPGFTQQFGGRLRRTINPDGSFNVHRVGMSWRNFNLYLFLVDTTWPVFFLVIVAAFLAINAIFAGIYLLLHAPLVSSSDTALNRYGTAFFFSVHTLTTVGYGDIYPKGLAGNITSSVEAMTGLLGFAIATGLFYGRFSRPTARIVFSRPMLVAPYQGGTSLQFRIANGRKNDLIELEARVLFMTVQTRDGLPKRDYAPLELERPEVHFLPLSWTIVHPIDDASPLLGKTAEDLARLEAEFLILIKAFDETFSQTVHARYSYRYDEVIWGARFRPPFYVDKSGDMVLELGRLNEIEKV